MTPKGGARPAGGSRVPPHARVHLSYGDIRPPYENTSDPAPQPTVGGNMFASERLCLSYCV